MAYLSTNFQNGVGNWRPVNIAGNVTVSYGSGTARTGQYFLRARTTAAGGSVAIDLTLPRVLQGVIFNQNTNQVNSTFSDPSNAAVLAWVRAGAVGSTISGNLAIWELNAPGGPSNSGDAIFLVDHNWALISNAMEFVPVPGAVNIRVEFYMNTVGVDLEVDSVIVC